jgi:hypothetical protein
MKKLLPILCLAALVGKAQPYGEKLYPHTGAFNTSGTNVTIHTTGFVMGGYVASATAGGPNGFVDKTGPGGVYSPASAFPFSASYIINGDRNCSTTMPQARFLTGMDVIEVQASGAGSWYAMAGSYEEGCYYAALSNTGNVIFKGFYPFPNNAIRPTKAIIVESNVPTEYYICGSFNLGNVNMMYVNRIKETGALISSTYYLFSGSNKYLVPADIIMSPYSPGGITEVVIVGQSVDAVGTTGTRGFLLRLNALSAGITYYGEYGRPATATGRDAFSSIAVANSPNVSVGFVIGGTSDLSPNNGQVWTLKTNPTGTTVSWSSLVRPTLDPSATSVVSVIERKSSVYGFTYYGAITSSRGMMVEKLDDNGIPFTGIPIDNFNEFLYPGVFSTAASSSDLSYLDNGGTSDIGLHVYGTDPGAAGGDFYFAEAAFNGNSDIGTAGCANSQIVTGMPRIPGPNSISNPVITTHPALVQCSNFAIAATFLTTGIKTICNSATLPAGGSNNRTTGIATEQKDASAFRVSPNPVTDKLSINFTASDNDAVDIRLYDYLGRFVQNVPVLSQDGGNNRVASLDMSTLNVESGVYIINATINGVRTSQKIIYTKGQ